MAARHCNLCASRRPAPHPGHCLVSLAHFVLNGGASLLRFLRRPRPIADVSFASNRLGRRSADAHPGPLQRTLVRAWGHVVGIDRYRRTVRCVGGCRRYRRLGGQAFQMQRLVESAEARVQGQETRVMRGACA